MHLEVAEMEVKTYILNNISKLHKHITSNKWSIKWMKQIVEKLVGMAVCIIVICENGFIE